VEEELNGLHHYHGWIVFLIQLQNRSDVTELARLLGQLPARFVGRWGEQEFVLILDNQQAALVEVRLGRLNVPFKIGRVEEDGYAGGEMEATAVITAARRSLT
jgi:GGDEF domain-containing protein